MKAALVWTAAVGVSLTLLVLLTVVALNGKGGKPQSVEEAGDGYQVARLFTQDGCTVYRFTDGGHWRYFARCDGAASSETFWKSQCGKHCTLTQNLMTGNTMPNKEKP